MFFRALIFYYFLFFSRKKFPHIYKKRTPF